MNAADYLILGFALGVALGAILALLWVMCTPHGRRFRKLLAQADVEAIVWKMMDEAEIDARKFPWK